MFSILQLLAAVVVVLFGGLLYFSIVHCTDSRPAPIPDFRHLADGKIYDSKQAELVAQSDEKTHLEVLYKLRAESWFVAKWGIGAAGGVKFRHHPDIEILSADAAYTWLVERQEVTLIETHFPERVTSA